jgi:ABC-type transporter MlaC component
MKKWLVVLLLALTIPSRAAVMDKTKSFVSQLLELGRLSRESKGVLTEQSRAAIRNLSSQIDFEALAAQSLGGTWKNLSAAKRKDFLKTLQESIEVLLFPKADRLTASLGEVKFSQSPKSPRQVLARTIFETTRQGELVEKDIEFELIFDARERVVDTILEGELVSGNLKRQFDQALKKKSFDQLLQQMKKRLNDGKIKKPAPESKKVGA